MSSLFWLAPSPSAREGPQASLDPSASNFWKSREFWQFFDHIKFMQLRTYFSRQRLSKLSAILGKNLSCLPFETGMRLLLIWNLLSVDKNSGLFSFATEQMNPFPSKKSGLNSQHSLWISFLECFFLHNLCGAVDLLFEFLRGIFNLWLVFV